LKELTLLGIGPLTANAFQHLAAYARSLRTLDVDRKYKRYEHLFSARANIDILWQC
jgi:hypothetical protein